MEITHSARKLDDLTKEIHVCILEGTRRFLRIGELLLQIDEENLWQHDDCSHSFLEFCEKAIHWKKSQVYNAIAVYYTFGSVLEGHLLDIEPTRLIRLLPIVHSKAEAETAVHEAATLDVKGFDNLIRENQGKVPTDDLKHEHSWEPWRRCSVCSKWDKGD